jgi:hypothetical protein
MGALTLFKFLFFLQSFRDRSNAVLGGFWSHRSRQLRIGWNKNIYKILGHVDVWLVFCHKHCCAVELTHCDDESFISVDIGKKQEH